MRRSKSFRKAQAELIAGLIILSVIFAVAIPLMIRIQTSTYNRQAQVANKAEFLEKRTQEALSISGVPQTDTNLRRGIFPGVWVNNTGAIPVTIHSVILLDKDTGQPAYIIDMAHVENNPIVEWAVINPGPNAQHVVPGEYPTLSPGDTLLIKFVSVGFDPTQYYVKIITARGSVLPGGGGTGYLVPEGVTGGAGGTWRGLFYPISGFKLMGAEEIYAASNIYAERPSYYVGKFVYRVGHAWIYDDYKYPAYYRVGYDYTEYRGFMGTFTMFEDPRYGLSVYIDGYHAGSSGSFKRWSAQQAISRGFLRMDDYDGNGVKELALDTIPVDADRNGNYYDDVMVLKVIVAKDIANADYVRLSAKIVYDYYVRVIDSDRKELKWPERIFYVAVYKYTPSGWVFVHYKDVPFSEHGPRSFVFDAIFPLNRTDVYRVALILLDPFRSVYRDYIEMHVGIEYFFAEWGINNPYFENLPTVYLLALNSYSTQGIGGDDKLQNLTSKVIDSLLALGVSNYIVIDNQQLLDQLLLDNPPKDAIVINLHGESSPINPNTVLDNVHDNGWIWVNIVGDPPVTPAGLFLKTSNSPPYNASIAPNSDGAYMVSNFSLYNLPKSILSNYSIDITTNSPTYVFYDVTDDNRLVVSAAWKYGDGYIVVNAFPELDWEDSDPMGTDPNFDAQMAAYTPLYIWLVPK